MNKRKVLFITPSLCQGGLEHSLITMLKLLDKGRYDITLFTYREDMSLAPLIPPEVKIINDTSKPHYFRKPKAILYNMIKTFASKLHLSNLSNKYSDKLKDYIHNQKVKYPSKTHFANEKFDVVVSNAIGIGTEMALYINAKKRTVFFRSSVDLHHDMLEKIFPKYDMIIGVSQGVKDMLQNAYPMVADKITVVENYVDSTHILEKADSQNDVIQKPSDDTYIISTCGRFSEEKGFDMAVEAAKLLKEKGCSFIWYFLGDGSQRNLLEERIKQYSLESNIVITGYLDNPFPYMKNSDIYVQPSYHESYGRTIKEAQILGIPIVSTDTVGGKTVLKDGEYGILTSIDANGLADGIVAMMDKIQNGTISSLLYTQEDNIHERETFVNKIEDMLS